MPTIAQWYVRVNAAWPDEVPALTFEQGVNAVRRLHRFVTGVTFSGEIVETSGNRYSWMRGDKYYLNVAGSGSSGKPLTVASGWKDLIHDLSHMLVRRVYAYRVKPHSREHARLELKMIKEVVKRGWLRADPIPESVTVPRKPDDAGSKLARILKRMETWERKRRRAETALKKLKRQARYYERKLGSVPSQMVH